MLRLPVLDELLGAAIGWREVSRYESGRVASVEVFRGNTWGRDYTRYRPLVVRGNYYDQKGRLLSRVRGGVGVVLRFFPNGMPCFMYGTARDNNSGPMVSWHNNGMLSFWSFNDEDGRRHGPNVQFYRNGVKISEEIFERDRRVGVQKAWYDTGVIKAVDVYEAGKLKVSETYDPSGVMTQRLDFAEEG